MKFLEQAELDLNLVNAVKQGDFDLVKRYIAEGASLEAKDKNGNSLLYLAAQNNDIVLFLKQAPQLNLGLINAAEKGSLDVVKEYISRGASPNAKNRNDETPLHKAAHLGKLEIVRYLVEKGADFNATNNYGHTPLYKAAYWGRLETVKYLIEKGADFNAKDNDGVTILHAAAQGGHLDIVKYLIEKGAEIEAKSNLNKTPLELALEHGNLKVADFLRSTQHHTFIKGAASSATKPESFIGGLFSWVKNSISGLFSSRAALPGNLPKPREHTKLHYAAGEGELNLVKLYVNQGYDISTKNEDGMTPLDIANLYRKSEVVSFLQEKQKEYNSLLLTAARNGNLNQVQNLLDRGANIEAKRNNGGTVLHEAVYYNRLDLAKLLVERGADINARNGQDETSLEAANRSGKSKIANFLREVQNRQRSRPVEQPYSDEMGYDKAKSGASRPFSWIKGSTESPALLASGGHDNTTVTAVPEISANVVNDALTLSNFAIRLFNKTQYRQPTPDNLLSQLERLMRSDKGDIIRKTIPHSEHNKSKVAEEQQRNLENKKPKSYLNNTSIQGHLTQTRDLRLR